MSFKHLNQKKLSEMDCYELNIFVRHVHLL